MQTKSVELKEFSYQAIKTLNSLLTNKEDYEMIAEIVQISPVSIQNPLVELKIRINSMEELSQIKIEVANEVARFNNRFGKYPRKRLLINVKQSTLGKKRRR